jgi:hypothetical protein
MHKLKLLKHCIIISNLFRCVCTVFRENTMPVFKDQFATAKLLFMCSSVCSSFVVGFLYRFMARNLRISLSLFIAIGTLHIPHVDMTHFTSDYDTQGWRECTLSHWYKLPRLNAILRTDTVYMSYRLYFDHSVTTSFNLFSTAINFALK